MLSMWQKGSCRCDYRSQDGEIIQVGPICNHKYPSLQEGSRRRFYFGEGYVIMEAGIGMICFEDGGKRHKQESN